ncbi:hypothetical protein CAS74_003611 [Pichia kudriavzevii]|uniref:Protein transport protein SEC1 n=1 Tax=Pichia kudriavzevii TaxID=4909 RepID=A0A099P6S2_PICKU|nr:uncharacterized protein C5L36_0B05160 [Pichia kudriavzevii]AWU75269.1 hypothetical protein C5L36_0B05160 [Pichia kudriavzevii]KGK39751.1 hypothetical protein JL09_g1081 [Pichia kudriavzevii]ONH73530.1 Protein transport protein SEC1 [Pichia kudriavzevii]OUT21492.1 hypothetical protein CAS74_003611 [Pichia kudriavzevii]
MSLYQIQKDALISDLNRVSSSHRHLIADDTTYPIIDKLFKDDVLNYVYTFKRIDSPDRSKNRDSALYILDPSRSFSLNCLAADFSKGQRYKDVVVMFIPGHWEHFWENMQKNHYFKESLVLSKVPLILEYMSFVPLEPRLYVTGNYHSIPIYYKPEKYGMNYFHYQLDTAVNSMLGMCVALNEYPTVRYYNSRLSKELATRFQQKLDNYWRDHPDNFPIGSKTVFLITDRTMDMFGPLCHYQYYRSQIFDLLDTVEVDRGVDPTATYSYKVETGEGLTRKKLVFNTDDKVYPQLRDLTIEKATDTVRKLYNNLKAEDAKFSNEMLQTANGLRHALVNKDVHLENKAVVTAHYLLTNEMWNGLKKEHVADIITFENLCAAGLGVLDHLKSPVTDGLLHLLANPEINIYNKIRLLVTYAIYRKGIIENDLRKLLMFSMPDKIENVLKLFKNLETLGVFALKHDLKSKAREKNTYFGVKDTDDQMNLMIPTYTNLVSRLVLNKLPEYYDTRTIDASGYIQDEDESLKTFPYVKAGPSPMENEGYQQTVRNQPKWKSTKNTNDAARQKVMLFCAGGLTPSEISSMSSLEEELNRNIIIGTDEIYTVWDMLGDINLINEDEFEFPLTDKIESKPVPQSIVENSMDPSLLQQQQQQQQQQQVPKKSHTHLPHLPLGHHHPENTQTAPEKEKKKIKGVMKKFKKFSI